MTADKTRRLQCGRLQRYVNTGTLLFSCLLHRLNRNSTQRRGRRNNFRNFQDAGTIDDRIG